VAIKVATEDITHLVATVVVPKAHAIAAKKSCH